MEIISFFKAMRRSLQILGTSTKKARLSVNNKIRLKATKTKSEQNAYFIR